MPTIPPLLNANIVAISIFAPSGSATPLDQPVHYDGKALFCHVRPIGTQLVFSIDGNPPNQVTGLAGSFTNAVAEVSYEGSTPGRIASQPIVYGGRGLEFYLRFDASFTRATVYVVEKPPALLEENLRVVPSEALSTTSVVTADPPSGVLVFFAIADKGEDDPTAPYKIIFVEKKIVVPDYLNHKTATILFGPPANDGGGEFGPMAIQIDP